MNPQSRMLRAAGLRIASWVALGFAMACPSAASGPLIDRLDGQPLGWKMVEADCPAEVRAHWLDAAGGLDRTPCEAVSLINGNGTRVILEYRLDPSHALDEVRASVYVQAIRGGPRVGLRIRYPRVLDPATRAPVESLVWGDTHRGRNQWEMLSVSLQSARRSVAEMGIRGRYGAQADLRDAYVDAVVLNAYTGAGSSTVRLDTLRVDGLISIDPITTRTAARGAASGAPQFPATIAPAATRRQAGGSTGGSAEGQAPPWQSTNVAAIESPFPAGRITRVIEYNGEQLEYLKLLGFDAVLLSRPPTAEILRGAIQHSMRVYAPPPTAPDPNLEPLLSVVAGWYLGTSYDDSQLQLAAAEEQRVRGFPSLWQRPCLIAPAESWDRFAGIATTIVYDLPPPLRGLEGREEAELLSDQLRATGRPVVAAIGVATLPPQRLVDQLDTLCRGLGASEVEDYGWHAMWLQVARCLAASPRAVIYRSSRSLESGREADGQRALALGMANGWLELVGPLVADTHSDGPLPRDEASYQVAHLAAATGHTVIATKRQISDPTPGAASGDRPLRIGLPRTSATFAWRITDTAAEQVVIEGDATTARITIPSPDLVEIVVTSSDPSVGAQLDRALRRHALRINQQRWQLVADSLMRCRNDWRAAVGGGLVPRDAEPTQLLRFAADALADMQPQIAAGEFSRAMRGTRIADVMALHCDAMLRERIRPPDVPAAGGMPTLMAPDGTMLHLAWMPSLEDGSWTGNLLASGDLDDGNAMLNSGWTHQRRLEDMAESAVGIDLTAGESGSGALRIESAGRGGTPMPGGYAGTVARVRSAPIQLPVGSWVRIEARVKTLGYGGANQGLLIYDSDAGSELGALVRGQPQWRTIRMFRVVTSDRPLRVTFEGLGAGETLVDWVQVAMWRPRQPSGPSFRAISSP